MIEESIDGTIMRLENEKAALQVEMGKLKVQILEERQALQDLVDAACDFLNATFLSSDGVHRDTLIHVHDAIRTHLLALAGIHPEPVKPRYTYASLRQTEWSSEFEEHMREHLVMGALRYGLIGDPNKPTARDRTGSMGRRLAIYVKTGNKRLLVDIANLCLLEFAHPAHPLANWSHDDSGEHVQKH